MAKFLHLLKSDANPLAVSVIEQSSREPGRDVTVVLLHGAPRPDVPAGVRVRQLGEDGFGYSALLDLIFESDHVVTW
jgi:hypothetical protein